MNVLLTRIHEFIRHSYIVHPLWPRPLKATSEETPHGHPPYPQLPPHPQSPKLRNSLNLLIIPSFAHSVRDAFTSPGSIDTLNLHRNACAGIRNRIEHYKSPQIFGWWWASIMQSHNISRLAKAPWRLDTGAPWLPRQPNCLNFPRGLAFRPPRKMLWYDGAAIRRNGSGRRGGASVHMKIENVVTRVCNFKMHFNCSFFFCFLFFGLKFTQGGRFFPFLQCTLSLHCSEPSGWWLLDFLCVHLTIFKIEVNFLSKQWLSPQCRYEFCCKDLKKKS